MIIKKIVDNFVENILREIGQFYKSPNGFLFFDTQPHIKFGHFDYSNKMTLRTVF